MPMKGVFLTPETGAFFPSDTDSQLQINVARHRHSELVSRHLTLHFSLTLTLTVSFPSRRRTLRKILGRRPTLRPPFMGPWRGYFRRQTLGHVFHPTLVLTFNSKLMSPDTDTQNWWPHTPFQHLCKFLTRRLTLRPPSWALLGVIVICYQNSHFMPGNLTFAFFYSHLFYFLLKIQQNLGNGQTMNLQRKRARTLGYSNVENLHQARSGKPKCY